MANQESEKVLNTTERRWQNQMVLWSTLGPWILLFIISVVLIKFVPYTFYIPFSMIVGSWLCWRWRSRGWVFSILLLSVCYGVMFNQIPAGERGWHFGMCVAIALGFIVSALSLDEVTEFAEAIKDRLHNRERRIVGLEDQLHLVQELVKSDIEKFKSEMSIKEQLIEVLHQELDDSQAKHQKVLDEVLLAHRENVALKSVLAQQKERVEAYVQSSVEMQSIVEGFQEEVRLSHKQMELYLLDLDAARQNVDVQLKERKKSDQFIEQLSREKLHLEAECRKLQREWALLQEQDLQRKALIEGQQLNLSAAKSLLAQKESECAQLNAQLIQLNQLLEEQAIREKQQQQQLMQRSTASEEETCVEGDNELRRASAMLKQLRQQFHEKSEVLNLTRHELFHANEKLTTVLRENQELEVYGQHPAVELLEQYITQLSLESESYQEELEREILELESLIGFLTRK